MIVVDASSVLAVLLREEDWEQHLEALAVAEQALLSPVGFWEAGVRLRQVREGAEREVVALLKAYAVEIAPVTARHTELALEAARRFGKGTPARLNLGDCFAYALAAAEDLPLLFKGDDFSHTDLRSVL